MPPRPDRSQKDDSASPARFEALGRLGRAAQVVPRLTAGALRHGLLPSGLSALDTLRREGASELHWKVLGDSLVRFLQHSGPVFTKLGQIAATRPDLLPATVCVRLEALYTKQAPMSRRELERSLAGLPGDLPGDVGGDASAGAHGDARGARSPFRSFDRRALAVGSVGQVHRATLQDGTAVIVKVLRPDVERLIERDLEGIRALLPWLLGSGVRADASSALLTKLLDDLAESFVEEVDLRREAASLREFARRFEGNPRVAVPTCYEALSTRRVLVMEELVGEPLSAVRERAVADPEAARRVASLALQEILRQIFEDGHFHADPHAGNLLILPDGRLGLIDLGLTGELRPEDRRRIGRAVRAFLARDSEALLRTLLEFGSTPDDFDLPGFRRDIERVVRKRSGSVVGRLRGRRAEPAADADANPLEEFVSELFGVAHAHGVRVPRSSTLLIKTLVTVEGVARSLNPDLDLGATARPVILRALLPRWMRWTLPAKG